MGGRIILQPLPSNFSRYEVHVDAHNIVESLFDSWLEDNFLDHI